ncbi:MAG: Tma20 N-terminal domain-containing protein [Candidatus Lokiarchaeota archaeon]|nr:Tma20 N-terminal domain-containing protein [Candidatus Lokiarchaeota archaeon]
MNMNIRQRHFIKSSEIKAIKDEILKRYDQNFVDSLFPKKPRIEVIITEHGDTLYAINNELKLWKSKEHGFIPVLTQLINKKIRLKKVVVDMGAIKYITLSGADIMRPGITKIDPLIQKGEIIEIVDETHDRSLVVGKALYNGKDMEALKSGKVIQNLHTINKNDFIWKFAKEFK